MKRQWCLEREINGLANRGAFANAGMRDFVGYVRPFARGDAPGGERKQNRARGWKRRRSRKPAELLPPRLAEKVRWELRGDLGTLLGSRWIIEVVAENLEIKSQNINGSRGRFAKARSHRNHQHLRCCP